MKKQPYLSIVIVGRNDNYGGDFHQRLQNFIRWNTFLLEKNELETEIIIVNWNPIAENKSLFESIEWTKNRNFVQYRIITVSNEIHLKYVNSKIRQTVPLFEYLAKNAGIRRAKGEFVLAMNPDIIIPENIIKSIKNKGLSAKKYYRADRIDYKKIVLTKDKNNNLSIQKIEPLKLWLKGFRYDINNPFISYKIYFYKTFNRLRVFYNLIIVKYLLKFEKQIWIFGFNFIKDNAELKYHCNVSGDFLILAKESWHKLKGNPENTELALHTDAIMVIKAASLGLNEKVYENVIFHQDHNRRYDTDNKRNSFFKKAYIFFQKEAQKMINNQKPHIYNDDKWGLINFELEETTF